MPKQFGRSNVLIVAPRNGSAGRTRTRRQDRMELPEGLVIITTTFTTATTATTVVIILVLVVVEVLIVSAVASLLLLLLVLQVVASSTAREIDTFVTENVNHVHHFTNKKLETADQLEGKKKESRVLRDPAADDATCQLTGKTAAVCVLFPPLLLRRCRVARTPSTQAQAPPPSRNSVAVVTISSNLHFFFSFSFFFFSTFFFFSFFYFFLQFFLFFYYFLQFFYYFLQFFLFYFKNSNFEVKTGRKL